MIGAEKPTLVEQFVGRLHLPYIAGCLGLSLLLGPGLMIANLVDAGSLETAIDRTLSAYPQQAPWVASLDIAVNTTIVFYMLLMIRYMRTKLVGVEPKLIEVTAGKSTLHRVFGHVSDVRAQIVSSLLLVVVVEAVQASSQLSSTSHLNNPASIVISLAIGAMFYLVAGTFVWVYAGSLWGLHRLGRQPLNLKSFQEDRLLGVGAVGSLSLGLMISYYTVVGPVAVESVLLSPDVVGYATLIPLVVLGGLMFFLPLYSIHRRMAEAKSKAEDSIKDRLVKLSSGTHATGIKRHERVSARIDMLIEAQMLQMAEKRLQEVPTWPYDIRTLEKFSAIFFSLLATVLGRVVLAGLKL